MNAADLRTLALARANQNHPVHLILDDQLRHELNEARTMLDTLTRRAEQMRHAGDLPPAVPQSLTEEATPAPDIDRMTTTARELVEAVQQEALDSGAVLQLNFHRLAPAEYQVNLQKAERVARNAYKADPENVSENQEFVRTLGENLVRRCFINATTPTGEPVEVTLDEILEQVCDHADVEHLRNHCISINREGAAAPLVPVSSGRPGKN